MFAWLLKLWHKAVPWWSRAQENEETLPEPDHPLLLLPGICGTQLGVRDKGADSVEDVASRVWVCIANAVRCPLTPSY